MMTCSHSHYLFTDDRLSVYKIAELSLFFCFGFFFFNNKAKLYYYEIVCITRTVLELVLTFSLGG